MFRLKNRAIQMKFVDANPQMIPEDGPKVTHILAEQISTHGKEFVSYTAVTIGFVYCGMRVVNTICNIAEIAAKAKLK